MQNPRTSGLALATLALVSVSSLATGQVGSLSGGLKITAGEGGFAGPLDEYDQFGISAAGLGDVNGDGIPDLAVGASGDDDGGPNRGAIWILFMNRDGTVQGQAKISQTQGGFTGALPDGAQIGQIVAAVGDLDGDGIAELASTTGGCPGERPRLWILFLDPDGAVRQHNVIVFHLDPAFTPTPSGCDFEDGGLAGLGDVDGDGVPDLAVGAPYDDDGPGADRGAVWIARMNPDGSVKSTQKLSHTEGGLVNELVLGANFGIRVSGLGDVDGDGNTDIGVVSGWPPGPLVDFEDIRPTRVLFLEADQRVRNVTELGFNEFRLLNSSFLVYPVGVGDVDRDGVTDVWHVYEDGVAITFLAPDASPRKALGIPTGSVVDPIDGYPPGLLTSAGDLDGDRGLELVLGDTYGGTPGSQSGAIYVLFTNGSAVRNGSGVNRQTLKGPDTVLGQTWGARLDCSANGAGVAVLTGWSEPRDGLFLPAGELLVGGQRLFVRSAAHAGEVLDFFADLPADPALVNLPLHVQGLCTGAPGPQLSNALDYVVGF